MDRAMEVFSSLRSLVVIILTEIPSDWASSFKTNWRSDLVSLLICSCITTKSSCCRWSWRRRRRCTHSAHRFTASRSNSSQSNELIDSEPAILQLRYQLHLPPFLPMAQLLLRENKDNPPMRRPPTPPKRLSFENSLPLTPLPLFQRNGRFLQSRATISGVERSPARAYERLRAFRSPLYRFAITRRSKRKGTLMRTNRERSRSCSRFLRWMIFSSRSFPREMEGGKKKVMEMRSRAIRRM